MRESNCLNIHTNSTYTQHLQCSSGLDSHNRSQIYRYNTFKSFLLFLDLVHFVLLLAWLAGQWWHVKRLLHFVNSSFIVHSLPSLSV